MSDKGTVILALCAGFLGGALSSHLTAIRSVAASAQVENPTFGTITANHLVILGDLPDSPSTPGIIVHADSRSADSPGILVRTDSGAGYALRVQDSTGNKMEINKGVALSFGKALSDSPDAVFDSVGLFLSGTTQAPNAKPTVYTTQINALGGVTLNSGTQFNGGRSTAQLSPLSGLVVSFSKFDANANPQLTSHYAQVTSTGLHQ